MTKQLELWGVEPLKRFDFVSIDDGDDAGVVTEVNRKKNTIKVALLSHVMNVRVEVYALSRVRRFRGKPGLAFYKMKKRLGGAVHVLPDSPGREEYDGGADDGPP